VIEEDRVYVTPCCISQLKKNKDGYAVEKVRGRSVLAHRAAYERVRGEIADGREIDHLCRQPDCVRVDHLEPVTHTENMRRGRRTKLTRDEVIEIRRGTETQQALADRYGIGQSQVSRIKSRESWRDLPDPEMSTEPDPSPLLSVAGASEEPHDQAQPDPNISKLAA
jgi:hypothetical protein